MIEGLWSMVFVTNKGSFGGGVVVFDTLRLFGGDASYCYVGNYKLEPGGGITAVAEVSQYLEGRNSVFYPLTNFILDLAGKIETPEFECIGNIREDSSQSIKVQLVKRAELPQ